MRHLNNSRWLLLFVLYLLAGCATTSVHEDGSSQSPVSQQSARDASQSRAKVHTELGSLYLQSNTLAVALDEARIAIAADPDYAPAYSLMGLIYMQMRENAAAEKSFEQALQRAPNDPEINNNFGWFLCQTGREQRSLDYFNVAIRSPLYATPAMPNTNAGICLLRLKNDREAEAYLQQALRFDPDNVRALLLLADIAYRQQRPPAARLYLQELHKRIEPTAESLWLAIRVEHQLGERANELELVKQLRQKFSHTPQYAKFLQGQYE